MEHKPISAAASELPLARLHGATSGQVEALSGFVRPMRLTHIGMALRDVEALQAALRGQNMVDPPFAWREVVSLLIIGAGAFAATWFLCALASGLGAS